MRARSGTPSQPGQDRPGGLGGPAQNIAPSIVIAEKEAYESGSLLLTVEAIPVIAVVGKATTDVHPHDREWGNGKAETQSIAAQQRSLQPGRRESRLTHVSKQGSLYRWKGRVAKRRAEGQVIEYRKPDFLIEHVCMRAQNVPELRIAAEPKRAADVDAPWPVSTAVEPERTNSIGAATAQPEIPSPVAAQQVAVEAAVGEVTRNSGREAEAGTIDGPG